LQTVRYRFNIYVAVLLWRYDAEMGTASSLKYRKLESYDIISILSELLKHIDYYTYVTLLVNTKS